MGGDRRRNERDLCRADAAIDEKPHCDFVSLVLSQIAPPAHKDDA